MCALMDEGRSPLVTVIVPVYKVEPYLEKCVDSVLCQTYSNLEVILVDDGSPDRCGEMCEVYAGLDSRVRVIHQENRGLSGARNTGLDVCQGEYVLFVDSDDWVEEIAVERLLQANVDNKTEAACCGYFDENGKGSKAHPLVRTEIVYKGDRILPSAVDGQFGLFAWNKLWKRDLFTKENRFPMGRFFEDLSTTWKFFDQCNRVVCIPDILFHYRIRRDSISNTKNMKNLVDHWTAYKERYDVMAIRSEEFLRICTRECLETIGYTWRWLHGVDKREKAVHTAELREMKLFLEAHRDCFGLCSKAEQVSLLCALHSNALTEAGCYYMNQVYRTIHGMNRME